VAFFYEARDIIVSVGESARVSDCTCIKENGLVATIKQNMFGVNATF
jgi:hypothetical protein